MSKKILITGKRNIEAISNEKDKKRKVSESWTNKEYLLKKYKQQNLINQLFLGEKFEGYQHV